METREDLEPYIEMRAAVLATESVAENEGEMNERKLR